MNMLLIDIDYSKLPPSLRAGTKRYIEQGILPGGFLRAVIQNNLLESFIQADGANILLMKDIVSFWYNKAPNACWGSKEKMKKWAKTGGFFGKKTANQTDEKH